MFLFKFRGGLARDISKVRKPSDMIMSGYRYHRQDLDGEEWLPVAMVRFFQMGFYDGFVVILINYYLLLVFIGF